MRIRWAIRLLLVACTGLYLSSYSSGPTVFKGDMTGSPLSTRGCAGDGCHGGGSYDPVTALAVLDARGRAVTQYRAGESYTVRISVATTGEPGAYGYQLAALGDADTLDAGSFGVPPADFQLTPYGGRTYLEHARRIEADTVSVPWTAPATGADTVRFYAIANAVNGTGGKGGDASARVELVLSGTRDTTDADSTETSAVAMGPPERRWRAYSAGGELTVRFGGDGRAPTRLTVHTSGGRLLLRRAIGPGAQRSIRVPLSTRGPLLVSLEEAGGTTSTKLVVAR